MPFFNKIFHISSVFFIRTYLLNTFLVLHKTYLLNFFLSKLEAVLRVS